MKPIYFTDQLDYLTKYFHWKIFLLCSNLVERLSIKDLNFSHIVDITENFYFAPHQKKKRRESLLPINESKIYNTFTLYTIIYLFIVTPQKRFFLVVNL